ncbi:MAG: cbb3-type cytochrome c oxidase subunit I [Gemmatimonadaceae bacterium]|nr:cbb3-type cytochrome c oxidase subunit I [Gemmatimonadaceae bacterium]
MYSLVRRYIKTAITFLAVGLAIGFAAMVRREFWGTWPSPYEISAHTHAILVGFVMMMIQGVALWLFPRPDKEDRRYDPRRAELAWWCMTVGTALRLAGELGRAWFDVAGLPLAIVAAGALQVAGIGVFFHTMWSRVRSVGSASREAKGERF